MAEILIDNTRPEYAEALEQIQRLVFGHLPEHAQYSAAMYQRHLEIFPEGQFTALIGVDNQRIPVGATTTFLTPDFDHIRQPFEESVSWLAFHDPDGEWLYGADISVHPDYRRRGVGSHLYTARAALVQKLNLRGEVAAGLLAGYYRYQAKMSIETYANKVARGELVDPTVSMQLRNGFVLREVLYDYVENPESADCAALIVRENPDYRA
ncbi:MAG: GNAT family N-acetyltransferase [Anaerolineae bacterium]|nr:GNAT family N-acetyltransferase [Anaerolineae bacterium]